MPELPEVEAVCRVMRRALEGKRIVEATASEDPIVFTDGRFNEVEQAITGREVMGVGRKGKYWWLELDQKPWLFGHLGMSGWITELAAGEASPKFLKLLLETEGGARIAFTDPRRLGRIWLSDEPETDKRIQRLGFDVLNELPRLADLSGMLAKRSAPIKAVLLDQTLLAGIGNYMADEVLYMARIAPARLANSLTPAEARKLRKSIAEVTELVVRATTSDQDLPDGWLFHVRWGGGKKEKKIKGRRIQTDTIGGRTTAWVPGWQK